MTKRIGISTTTRFEIFKRDKFTCQYCGRAAPDVLLQVDHIHPVAKGGETVLLNLVTSCSECNHGKRDKLLSDDSAVAKQRNALNNLQERKEQIEMMLNWHRDLGVLEDIEVSGAVSLFDHFIAPFSLSNTGKETIAKSVKKFGLPAVLDAIQISKSYLKYESPTSTNLVKESVENALHKIGGICVNTERQKENPELKDLYYIVGILKNKHGYNGKWYPDILNAYKSGVSIEAMKESAANLRRVGEWRAWVASATETAKSGGSNDLE